MKKIIAVIYLILAFANVQAQNYLINFVATGGSTTVDSVQVQNTTQGTHLSLLGTDILHLTQITTGIINNETNDNGDLQIIPNPVADQCQLLFNSPAQGNYNVEIFDISGKCLFNKQFSIDKSRQLFNITGISEGLYLLTITGSNTRCTIKFVSTNVSRGSNLNVNYEGAWNKPISSTNKEIETIIDMNFNNGDNLVFKGYAYSGGLTLTNIVNASPTANATITFVFPSGQGPTLTTNAVSSITTTTAYSGGTITSNGGSSVTARGVCWSTSPNPTISDPHTSNGTGIGTFISYINGLTQMTTYHVRAYATNSIGTAYGQDISFTTLAIVLPTITTSHITSITTTTAYSGGTITFDGGANITAKGVCWSTNPNPTTSDPHTSNGTGIGTFTSYINGLTQITTYHVRAYATNSLGTAYGGDSTFTTIAIVLPTITTSHITSITTTTAYSGGTITFDGGANVTAKGVCWSTTPNPTTTDSHTSNGTGIGTFTSYINGLTQITTYHVRAYATNSLGTAYGGDSTFTTIAIVLPTISTSHITSITTTTAYSGGTITFDGGANVTAKGVCWSTNPNPTTTDSHTSNGTGIGTFTSYINGLTQVTTYHVRAYATNSLGTAYGGDSTFTTIAIVLPTITTSHITSITTTTAYSGGTITFDGGANVTAKGVCWSTSPNPTTTDSHTSNGTGIGTFTSYINGLTQVTTYHVRAYATNSLGTAYGGDSTFTTIAIVLPTITTSHITSITTITAYSGGTITFDGGANVSAKGVCWSVNPNPTTSDPHTSNGTGIGTFTSYINGLTQNTTYHVRAYATNSLGTAYGADSTFTTLAITIPTVTTTNVTSITTNSAYSGGNITSDGGSPVTARGVCGSTSPNPTISDPHTSNGTGTGSFTSYLSGLTSQTTYYIRAYATNSVGTAYGAEIVFTTY